MDALPAGRADDEREMLESSVVRTGPDLPRARAAEAVASDGLADAERPMRAPLAGGREAGVRCTAERVLLYRGVLASSELDLCRSSREPARR